MHALPLYVNLLFIHLFICCLFFLFLFSRFYHIGFPFLSFVFSVYDLLLKHVFGTSALFDFVHFCLALSALFVFACLSFLFVLFFSKKVSIFVFIPLCLRTFSFFLLSFFTFCFSFVSFFCHHWMYVFFFDDSLWFGFPFFFSKKKNKYIFSSKKIKNWVFLMCFSFFFFKGVNFLCVFSFFLLFSSSEEGFSLWKFVLTHFEASFSISSLFPSWKLFQKSF